MPAVRPDFALSYGQYGAANRAASAARLGATLLNVLGHDAPLTLREFVTHEQVPLASVFAEVLPLLSSRDDVAIFGAHAVNAFATTERMTQDIDVLTTHAAELSEALRQRLAARFHIAVRVRDEIALVGGAPRSRKRFV